MKYSAIIEFVVDSQTIGTEDNEKSVGDFIWKKLGIDSFMPVVHDVKTGQDICLSVIKLD